MYTICKAKISDITTVFNFTNNLVQYHEGMTEFFLTDEDSMLQSFKNNDFECLILFEENQQERKAVGYILYMEEYSILHGYGYYIDDFFVSPDLRGKGLGKMLMYHMFRLASENNVKFLKLVFQRSIFGLEKMYTGLGFENVSAPSSGVEMYEVFGKEGIRKMVGDNSEKIESKNKFHFYVKKRSKGIS